jgi:hypothetical protein
VKLSEIAGRLELEDITPELQLEATVDVSAGHASDLLSDVLANAPAGGILVTIQVHLNVIAVSVHAGVAAVIFASGRVPEESVRARAVEEGIQLYTSKQPTFDVAGQLYTFGLRGSHE